MIGKDNIVKINVLIHRIKGRIQSTFMSFGLTKSIIVTIITVLFAVAVSLLRFILDKGSTFANSILEFIVGLSAAVSALYTLFTLIIEYNRRANGTIFFVDEDEKKTIKENLKLGNVEENDGFKICGFFNGESSEKYIESKEFNAFLQSGTDITFYETKRKFEIPDEVKILAPAIMENEFRRPNLIFNSKLIRQASHPDISKRSVRIQKTDYFSGQCSHEIVYKQFIAPGSIGVSFSGEKMLNCENGSLYDLTRSPCANFIGVSMLVITRDKHIIIGKQAMFSKANKGRFAPSGSGSVDYADIRKACKYYGKTKRELTFNEILTYAMTREFCEECNYSLKRAKKTLKNSLTGYVRLIERGGKPDYFGIGYLDDDIENIQKNIRNSERGLVDTNFLLKYKNINDIPEVLEAFCTDHIESKQLSIQLYLIAQQLKDMHSEGVFESALSLIKSESTKKAAE